MPWQQCFLNRHILHGERSALLKSARQVKPHPGMLHPTVSGRFVGVLKDSRDRTGMPPPGIEPIQRIENSTSFSPMNALNIWNADSVSKMFNFLSFFPDFGHRTDTHFQMHVDEFGIHPSVHFLSFDSVRHQRHVGNK